MKDYGLEKSEDRSGQGRSDRSKGLHVARIDVVVGFRGGYQNIR